MSFVTILSADGDELLSSDTDQVGINVADPAGFGVFTFGESQFADGTDGTFSTTFVFELGAGSYLVTGADAGLLATRLLELSPGSYLVTGSDISFFYELEPFLVGPGSYLVTGSDVTLDRAFLFLVESGSYAVTGNAAVLGFYGIGGFHRITVVLSDYRRAVIENEHRHTDVEYEDRLAIVQAEPI